MKTKSSYDQFGSALILLAVTQWFLRQWFWGFCSLVPNAQGFDMGDIGDIFGDFFGRGGRVLLVELKVELRNGNKLNI